MTSMHGDTNSRHLSREELARLVDDVATPAERRHLEACDRCMTELSALSAQTQALSALPDIDPPQGEWEVIEARLPVPRGKVAPVPSPTASTASWGRSSGSGWVQAAAGLTLFLAGGVAGAGLMSGFSPPRDAGPTSPVALAPEPLGNPESSGAPEPVGGSDVSLTESEAIVGMAEDLYMDALMDYRQRVAETDPALLVRDPMGRLVMLENLLAATEAAVREAPADPFFNGVLASTTAEHRAVVAQMTALTTPTW